MDTVSMTTGIFPVFLIFVELLFGIKSLSGTVQAPQRTSLWGTQVLSLMQCSIVSPVHYHIALQIALPVDQPKERFQH